MLAFSQYRPLPTYDPLGTTRPSMMPIGTRLPPCRRGWHRGPCGNSWSSDDRNGWCMGNLVFCGAKASRQPTHQLPPRPSCWRPPSARLRRPSPKSTPQPADHAGEKRCRSLSRVVRDILSVQTLADSWLVRQSLNAHPSPCVPPRRSRRHWRRSAQCRRRCASAFAAAPACAPTNQRARRQKSLAPASTVA